MNALKNQIRSIGLLGLLFAGATVFLLAHEASHPPGSEAAARALLKEFLDPAADHASLTAKLRPTRADYDAVFTSEAAAKLFAACDPAWQQGEMVVKGKPDQTQLLLWSATTDDLRAWRGNASERFPGGYKDIAAAFKPGQTIHVFKFVAPGQSLGMAFDGLVYVKGGWRLFPKPWRALR
jgi:hypothetical protein